MKLPDELLKRQFASKLLRGAIVRFEFDGFADPKKTGHKGPKFAVILNRPDVSDPIYLALTTSKTAVYQQTTQFDSVVLKIPACAYSCFPIDTVVALRANPIEGMRDRLQQQFVDGKLTFVGQLVEAHLRQLDDIIARNPYIQTNLKPYILP